MDRRTQIKYIPAEDYYKLFGITSMATTEEIHQAFRRLAKQVHPDLNPNRKEWAHQQFQKINTAHDILTDPSLRSQYDALRTFYLQQKTYVRPQPTYQKQYQYPQYQPKPQSKNFRASVFVMVWLAITLCSIIGRLGSNSSSSSMNYPYYGYGNYSNSGSYSNNGGYASGGYSNSGMFLPTTVDNPLLATYLLPDSSCPTDVQITDPTDYQSEQDPFYIYGTVQGNDIINYSIFLRYGYDDDTLPWLTLVDSATPPVDDQLRVYIPKSKMPATANIYTVRLSVTRTGGLPENCDVHIVWTAH